MGIEEESGIAGIERKIAEIGRRPKTDNEKFISCNWFWKKDSRL